MKKNLFLLVLLVSIASFLAVSFAEETGEEKPQMMHHKKHKKGEMEKACMHCMMAKKMMMDKKMVATSDGGVVILFGNKLMKYDKKLELIKEVELNIDPMMEKMKECREMMKKYKSEETLE